MMNFPSSPTVGQNYSTYTFDGEKWVINIAAGSGVPEAPTDHKIYGRKDLTWQEVISDVTKAYVDAQVALRVAKTGDVMSGGLSFGAASVVAATDVTRHLALYSSSYGFSITGGTLNIVSNGAAIAAFHSADVTISGSVLASGRGFSPSNVDLAGLSANGSYGGGLTLVDGANRACMWAQSADLALATGAGVAPAIKLLLANNNNHTLYGSLTTSGGNLATNALSAAGITCSAINTQGNRIDCGTISCYDIYMNGYGLTTWGITNYGQSNLSAVSCGAITCTSINMQDNALSCGSMTMSSYANYLTFYDYDWGPMHIHHNGDSIGFLNNGGGWAMYARNDGLIYCSGLGWLHDWVNGQIAASFNQCVTAVRWVWAGGPQITVDGNYHEDIPHSAITGYAAGLGNIIANFMYRYLQVYTANSGWQTVYYAD